MAAALLALLSHLGTAQAVDPKVPPGSPGQDRVPIAILTTGFDYTRPDIAARLARDGEGEIIAWDVPGNDRFPHATIGDTDLMTALAALIPETAPVSLLAVKVDPADPASLAKSLAFVARTPARTVLVPMWTSDPQIWTVFAQVAARAADLRLLVRGCPDMPISNDEHVYPRDLGLANSVTQASAPDDPSAVLQNYVAALPCRRP